jgi:hypothetical protein
MMVYNLNTEEYDDLNANLSLMHKFSGVYILLYANMLNLPYESKREITALNECKYICGA